MATASEVKTPKDLGEAASKMRQDGMGQAGMMKAFMRAQAKAWLAAAAKQNPKQDANQPSPDEIIDNLPAGALATMAATSATAAQARQTSSGVKNLNDTNIENISKVTGDMGAVIQKDPDALPDKAVEDANEAISRGNDASNNTYAKDETVNQEANASDDMTKSIITEFGGGTMSKEELTSKLKERKQDTQAKLGENSPLMNDLKNLDKELKSFAPLVERIAKDVLTAINERGIRIGTGTPAATGEGPAQDSGTAGPGASGRK